MAILGLILLIIGLIANIGILTIIGAILLVVGLVSELRADRRHAAQVLLAHHDGDGPRPGHRAGAVACAAGSVVAHRLRS